jgi:hypothetical protein
VHHPQKAKENTKVLKKSGRTKIQRYDPELVLSISGSTMPQSTKLKISRRFRPRFRAGAGKIP